MQILDLNRNKLVLNEQFIIVEKVLFEFNRRVYYSEKDFENANLWYSFDDMEPISIQLTKVDKIEIEGWKTFHCNEIVINDFMALF